MRSEEEQRIWNMIIFKVPLTDAEIQESGPTFFIIAIIMLLIIGVFWLARK